MASTIFTYLYKLWSESKLFGNRQHATDSKMNLFWTRNVPVPIKTCQYQNWLTFAVYHSPIMYYASDRCYCSILNSSPPSALYFIIPVGFLIFYKMFWYAAKRTKEGIAWISFHVQLPSYIFPPYLFLTLVSCHRGPSMCVQCIMGGSKPNIFCNRRAHQPLRSQSPPERELLLNA